MQHRSEGRNAQTDLVYSTSVVVMPPPNFWPAFVDIKKHHMNPRIKRPPFPHVTLLAPFVRSSKFDEAEQQIREVTQTIEPFQLNFATFEIFNNRQSQTLFLKPEITPPEALQELFEKLDAKFPGVRQAQKNPDQYNFEPHIGVGYFKNLNEAKRLQKQYQTGWEPIDFQVKEIYILSRTAQDSPFAVRRVIPLGSNPDQSSQPHFQPKPE